jgi:PAS domain S-box-containing protein
MLQHLSGEQLRALVFDQMPEAAILADTGGIIRLWNRGAESLFGFAAAEAVGASLDLIIPERLRQAHDAGFRRALETRQMKFAGRVMTTRATHKQGHRLYVDFSFGLLEGGAGELLGVLAIGRDVTARELARRQHNEAGPAKAGPIAPPAQ